MHRHGSGPSALGVSQCQQTSRDLVHPLAHLTPPYPAYRVTSHAPTFPGRATTAHSLLAPETGMKQVTDSRLNCGLPIASLVYGPVLGSRLYRNAGSRG